MTEVFHEVNKSFSVEQSHLNKIFTICDSNDDKKLTRKEFLLEQAKAFMSQRELEIFTRKVIDPRKKEKK